MMRCAIYARVSTADQSTSMQQRDLHKLAGARGFEVVTEYCDEGQSGAKNSRPALDRMLADARRGKFQVLLVWRLDRLGRSLAHLIRLLEDFKVWNVELVSFSEGLDFTTSTGKLFYSLLGAFSEFEREVIRERVRSGMRNARARGVKLGRKVVDVDAAEVRRLRSEGRSFRAISREMGVSAATIHKTSRRQSVA
jgi:DNA invertase Pin-like site-specific DNA recombinase